VVDGRKGAWAEFVNRVGDAAYILCADVFSCAELDQAYLETLGRLRPDDFAWLRAYDGRSTLVTYLRVKIGRKPTASGSTKGVVTRK
jgi:hypothetical protein